MLQRLAREEGWSLASPPLCSATSPHQGVEQGGNQGEVVDNHKLEMLIHGEDGLESGSPKEKVYL